MYKYFTKNHMLYERNQVKYLLCPPMYSFYTPFLGIHVKLGPTKVTTCSTASSSAINLFAENCFGGYYYFISTQLMGRCLFFRLSNYICLAQVNLSMKFDIYILSTSIVLKCMSYLFIVYLFLAHNFFQETNRLEYLIPKKTSLRHRLPVGDQCFIDFLTHLLEINPKKRPSATEALKHPWLSYPYEPISS